MYIKVNCIADFLTMIMTCTHNGVNQVRVFIADSANESNYETNFTYVLFTPLYIAIYSGTVSDIEYDHIGKSLMSFQDSNADKFRIQVFEKIIVKNNCIDVTNETCVI